MAKKKSEYEKFLEKQEKDEKKIRSWKGRLFKDKRKKLKTRD